MKILCLGSLNMDLVYKVEHFVSPGETIPSLSLHNFCGGKGLNQSIALARAGAKVYHAGKVGKDGAMLIECLKNNNVNVDYTKIEKDVPSGHAIIQVDQKGQNCIIIHAGANSTVTKDYIDSVLSKFDANDILLLQNEVSNIEYAIIKAHERGMKVALNPSPIDNKLANTDALKYVHWFILNEVEGYAITGKKEGKEICEALISKYKDSHIVLTLGKKGCIYYDKQLSASHGIYDVPVVDTTGAGDTFAGYFLTCMIEGLDIETALMLASKASSLTVSRAGASDSIPSRRETENTDITPKVF